MTIGFHPIVDEAIWRLRPDFAALSVVVVGGRNATSDDADAGAIPRLDDGPPPPWGDAHIESWREAYRAFGARPQRTPSSVEALRRRLERDGALPRINAIVDLYNAISVRYALPVGGEDLDAYVGTPRLVRAAGGESFETMRDGMPWAEQAEPGEVVWRDDRGVTCRRWNWRQSVRTRLTEATTSMWFVLERLDPMPLEVLREAGDLLAAGVRALAQGASVEVTLLARG